MVSVLEPQQLSCRDGGRPPSALGMCPVGCRGPRSRSGLGAGGWGLGRSPPGGELSRGAHSSPPFHSAALHPGWPGPPRSRRGTPEEPKSPRVGLPGPGAPPAPGRDHITRTTPAAQASPLVPQAPWTPAPLNPHHRCPQPPAPPYRLMEGLHHGLGVVGFVVNYGLLQGLVIELLHVLGDLGKEVLTAQGDRPPKACLHLALLEGQGGPATQSWGWGALPSTWPPRPLLQEALCDFLPKEPAQRSAPRPSPYPPHRHPCPTTWK